MELVDLSFGTMSGTVFCWVTERQSNENGCGNRHGVTRANIDLMQQAGTEFPKYHQKTYRLPSSIFTNH
jgi:hypothetical protein